MEFVGIGSEAAVNWYSWMRDVCSWWLLQPEKDILFGLDPPEAVEVDESAMRTPKYHRGHATPQRWIFGIYD